MFESTISLLRVSDARTSEAFYCDTLGFRKSWEIDLGEGEPVFIEVTRDRVSLHLSEYEGDGPLGIQLYVNVSDAEELHETLVDHDALIVEPLHHAEWGHMVFAIQDPDGNLLRFGSPV